MITLNKYIKESLLSDFDELSKAQDDNIVIDELKKADKCARKTYVFNSDNGDSSHIEDRVLKLAQVPDYNYNGEVIKHLNNVKILKDFDTISSYYSLTLSDDCFDDKNLAKRVDIFDGVLHIDKCPNINNIEFNIRTSAVKGNKQFSINIISQSARSFDPITFNNCKINGYGKTYVNRMWLHDIPIFNNCEVNRVDEIIIYSANIIKDRIDVLEKIFDKTYLYQCYDHSKDSAVEKKGDLKNIYAAINNRKRYSFKMEGPKLFSIDKKFKLNDLIDISGFGKEFNNIIIRDNNVAFEFFKANTKSKNPLHNSPSHNEKYYNVVKLPNDDWYLLISKRDR